MQKLKHVFIYGLLLVLPFAIISSSIAQEREGKKDDKLTTEARLTIFKAQTAMSEEKPEEALTILDKYLATQPDAVPPAVYELYAYIWLEKKDNEKALKYFRIMYEAEPDNAKVLKNLASLTFQVERYAEAAVLFEKLYEVEDATTPGGSLPYAVNAYMMAEDLVNSKRLLKKLVGLPGEIDAKWYEWLINICLEQDEMNEAEEYIIDLLRINPVQARYWKHLAQIRIKREEWQAATSDLEISYRVEAPHNLSEWIILGDLYRTTVNAPLMGARCYMEAYKENSAEKDYISISRTYEMAYRYDDAVRILNEGIRKNPASTALLLEKGRVLYDARRYTEAIAALEECLKIDPQSGDALFQIGLSAWTLREWDKARTAFVQAKRLSEKYSAQCDSVIDLLDDLNEEKAEVMATK
ncbi:MAG: tetratricopeptide repeat protein [Deltaproteobacteria bacterium]|nr:tetratricopeptide repeat protein [Deltaproteobacteria bacterium]